MYEAGGRIVHGKLSRQESEVSQCLRRCRMEQPVTSTAADYRLPAPQFLGRQPMLEINGLTGRVTDEKTEEPVARPAEDRIKRGRGGGHEQSTGTYDSAQ